MNEKIFYYIYNPSKNDRRIRMVSIFFARNSIIVFILAIMFLIVQAILTRKFEYFFTLFFCIVALIIVTVLGKIINAKRPFEELPIKLYLRHSKGESFPSRHACSAYIIAFMFLWISPIVGVFLLILASLMSLARISVGIHYPRDILAGFLISFILFIITYIYLYSLYLVII